MNYKMKIELQSAANPGSGEGWAGMIDSDVVFDDSGIPFIPARRIKGILRELAVDIVSAFKACSQNKVPELRQEHVDTLFGVQGQQHSAPLRIGNAYLEHYQQAVDWLLWAQHRLPHLASPDRVISVLTHLRKQTAIASDGVQADHSLRVTRVLNPGYHVDGEYRPLTFFCEIEILVSDPNLLQQLEKLLTLAATVTRYLGGKRNRGLGKVRCELVRP